MSLHKKGPVCVLILKYILKILPCFPKPKKKKKNQLNKLHLTENIHEKGIHYYFIENINTQAHAHTHTKPFMNTYGI